MGTPQKRNGPKSVTYLVHAISQASPAQREMLRVLGDIGRAATVAEVAQQCHIHNNSARETLEALVEEGLVVKTSSAPSGRGRPAWLYEVTAPDSLENFQRQISDLVISTARLLVDEFEKPLEAAHRLGRAWGRQFLSSGKIPEHGNFDLDGHLADLELQVSKIRVFLSTQGFRALSGSSPNSIELHSCPYLTNESPVQPVVCAIHASMLEEIVSTLSQGALQTHLCPFVNQDYCEVTLNLTRKPEAQETAEAKPGVRRVSGHGPAHGITKQPARK